MKLTTREMMLASMFAAMTVVAAVLVRFGAAVVPFSLVPFVVILAGATLGARGGAMAMVVYVMLGMVGLPVFEKPPYGGPSYVLQPTFGFLLGFIAGAWVTGKIITQKDIAGPLKYILAGLAGIVAIYLMGLPYLYVMLNFYMGKAFSVIQVIQIGFAPFIALDIVKAVLAALLARTVVQRVSG